LPTKVANIFLSQQAVFSFALTFNIKSQSSKQDNGQNCILLQAVRQMEFFTYPR